MNIDAGWAAVAVSSIAAIISVCAAFYAGIQASAAKRQADAAHGDIEPTFHCEIHEDDGRAPWGFRLIICNFNRHSLRLRAIDVAVPASLIVWRNDEYEPDRIRNTIEAVVRRGAASFEVNKVLSGVSPNAAQPTTFEVDFYVGIRTTATQDRHLVDVDITVYWAYASGADDERSQKLKIRLPVGLSG